MSALILREFNIAMRTGLAYTIRKEHTNSTGVSIKREASEYSNIRANLHPCSPFSSDPALRNIVNGILAKYEGNMHE